MSDIVFADVSHHQGSIDWAAYARAAGHVHRPSGLTHAAAAICKATGGTHTSGGTSRVDPKFAANRAAMRDLLKLRGYYHFLQLNADPVAQAGHFAKTVGELQPGEFAVLDVEQDNNTARHEQFCAEVDRLLGGRCWIYGGKDVDNPNGRPYWVARYPNSGKPDPSMEPKPAHVLWQFTSKGSCPGVSGNVDLNVHRGDLDSLARFAVRKAAKPAKPAKGTTSPTKPAKPAQPPAQAPAPAAAHLARLVQVKGDPAVYLVSVDSIRHLPDQAALGAECRAGICESEVRQITKADLRALAKARGVTL